MTRVETDSEVGMYLALSQCKGSSVSDLIKDIDVAENEVYLQP